MENTMCLARGRLLQLAAAAPTVAHTAGLAWAQAYPSRPLRLIVGFPAGGPTDITARLIGQWLSERLGPPCVIDNRPGAGRHIAPQAGGNPPADGYTPLLLGGANAVQATPSQKLNFNFILA